ncbi:MAG: lipopolysaccharide heptosyltransferase I [Gammaproteobacteria bacterium]
MKILVIKMSSIGDLIHTFPAIIDAKLHIKDLSIDWMVDEDFLEIINIYKNFNNLQAIDQIISIPLRKIKRNILKELIKFNFKNFLNQVRSVEYDLIIDPQGLLKSALLAKLAKTKNIVGFDFNSCREKFASFLYQNKITVNKDLHAIFRTKKLFANSLNYPYQEEIGKINYGLDLKSFKNLTKFIPETLFNHKKYIVLLHGTSWESKHWSINYWNQLSKLIIADNISIVIFVNDIKQQQFAEQLLTFLNNTLDNNESNNYKNKIIILSKLNFSNIIVILANALGVVAVDTGFAHLAASIGLPIVGIYGPTSISRSGVLGNKSLNLQSNYPCSPCYSRICLKYYNEGFKIKQPCFLELTPNIVFEQLIRLIT